MRDRFLVVLAALAGCGRLSFDPSPGDAVTGDGRVARCDQPVGHDEDGDGVDDVCDVCPQVADDQRDSDGDLVGDACDLESSHEQRVLFDPFTAPRPEWSYDAAVTFNSDSITMPALTGTTSLRLAGAPGRTVVEAGGRVTAVGNGDRQIAFHIGQTGGANNYYCELYDAGGGFNLKLTHDDNNNYTMLAMTPIPGRLSAGSTVRFIFEHTPPNLRCVAWWNGVRYEAVGTDPGGVPIEQMFFAVNSIEAEVAYFVRLVAP